MFGAVGAPVERLVRVRIGPVRIDGLRSGAVRPLKAPEVRGLGAGGGRSARRTADAARGGRTGRTIPVRETGPVSFARWTRWCVALDGPGSSGKSSVGAAAARRARLPVLRHGAPVPRGDVARRSSAASAVDDPEGLVDLVRDIELVADAQGRLSRVDVDGVDHTDDVRGPAVEEAVSAVSAVPEVRGALLERQRGSPPRAAS